MADNKEKVTDNKDLKQEEKKVETPTTPDGHPIEPKEKFGDKIKAGWAKHKKKVLTGIGIAGAFAGGVIADKIGIKFGGQKGSDADNGDE